MDTRYRTLGLAVIRQAQLDATAGDTRAAWWLRSNSRSLQFWCAVGDLDPGAVASIVQLTEPHS
jgi:hypothetical protein